MPLVDFVPQLDIIARSKLVAALSREDVARACCVSAAWRRALGGDDTRSLWAHLDFAPPQFTRRVTPAVVRGACARAGEQLRSVAVHDAQFLTTLLELLGEQPGGHPRLTRVALRGGRTIPKPVFEALLRLAPPLEELWASAVSLGTDDLMNAPAGGYLALLRHSALRASSLYVHVREWPADRSRVVHAVADTVRSHAAHLDMLRIFLPYEHGRLPLDDDLVAPLVDALCSCTALEKVTLPLRQFSTASFRRVAEALAQAPTALRDMSYYSADFPARHYPTVLQLLLPRLESLLVKSDFDVRAAAAALLDNATLRELKMDIFSRIEEDDPGARAALCAAMATMKSLRSVEISLCYFQLNYDIADLEVALSSLPATVEEVKVEECTPELSWGAASHTAFFAGLRRLTALSSFELVRVNREVEPDLMEAMAAALLLPAADGSLPRLQKLAVRGQNDVGGCPALAAALRSNTTLVDLTLCGPLRDEALYALADVVQHNTSLRELTVTITQSTHADRAEETARLPAAVDAFAASLRANRTLQALEFFVVDLPREPEAPADLAALSRAVGALEMRHDTCRATVRFG